MSLSEASSVAARLPVGLSARRASELATQVKSVLILKTLWYPEIVDALAESAQSYLHEAGIATQAISTHAVPGSFELPLSAQFFAELQKPTPDFIVAVGLVLEGGTPHFDYVCRAVTDGLARVSLENRLPIGFGVLTVNTLAQAEARKEKGREAAQAAFLMYCQKQMLTQGEI